jgi:hypothetical protein
MVSWQLAVGSWQLAKMEGFFSANCQLPTANLKFAQCGKVGYF